MELSRHKIRRGMMFKLPDGSIEEVIMIGFAYDPNAKFRKKGRRIICTSTIFDVDLSGAKYLGFCK